MPTSTELVNLICQDAGLDNASPSTDRTAALGYLNQAYRQITQQVLRRHPVAVDHTPTAGTTDVDLSTVTTLKDEFLALDHIRVVEGSDVSKPITRLTRPALLDSRSTDQAKPGAYSYAWPFVYLDRPADGAYALRISYAASPSALTDDAVVPAHVPPGWQDRLLAKLAVVLALEGLEGDEQRAGYHRGLYNEALQEFRLMQQREGGLLYASDGHSAFDSPDPLGVR